jgi:hypothetical protein
MAKKYLASQLKKLLKIDEKELEPYFLFYLKEKRWEDLTTMQQEKLERYRKIWSWYCMGRPKEQILSAIKRDYNIEVRQAEYDLTESIHLHGKLDQVDKDGMRVASREYYYMLSQLALKEKQYNVAADARRKGDELAGLFETEVEGWDPEDWKKPVKQVWNVIQVNNYNAEESKTINLDE